MQEQSGRKTPKTSMAAKSSAQLRVSNYALRLIGGKLCRSRRAKDMKQKDGQRTLIQKEGIACGLSFSHKNKEKKQKNVNSKLFQCLVSNIRFAHGGRHARAMDY
jgi:hypothetical protein